MDVQQSQQTPAKPDKLLWVVCWLFSPPAGVPYSINSVLKGLQLISEFQETLLDTKSSTAQKILKPSYRDTLLQSCEDDMIAAEYIYMSLDEESSTEKLDRLTSCRTGARFMRNSETGQIRVASQSCHLRHCPICTRTRTLTIKSNVTDWLKTARYPKILTVTLKHSDLPLKEQIDRLYKSFRALRTRKILKKTCIGGIWFFQVKKSKTDGLFHPHIHCLVAGGFIPQNALSKAWFKITGDSHVVDVRMVKDPVTAARHVSRYAANPCSLKPLSLKECLLIAKALSSRRLVGSWGICRKLKLTAKPEIDKTGWYQIGSWNAVFEMQHCDGNAKAILHAWKTGKPLPVGISMDFLYRDTNENEQASERGSPMLEQQSFFEWRSPI